MVCFISLNEIIYLSSKLRYSGRKGFVKIPLTDSFQIDTREDLDLIRKLI